MESYVHVTPKENYVEVEFFTPQSNSLPSTILEKLAHSIDELGRMPDHKILLLKSGGEKAFCAGASFEELSSISTLDEGQRFFSGFSSVILAIRNYPGIVLGRIHGKAVGGGVGLAAACDYAMASQFASVRLSELAVGIGPFVIGPAVERKIGLSAFSKMALNATEWQTAEWAKNMGLYHEVFETVEQLDQYIEHFSGILSASNPEALSALKQVFWAGTEHWEKLMAERASISGRLVMSDYTRKAISKFKAG
jgi:methylglutaconyl-CoA hydratase